MKEKILFIIFSIFLLYFLPSFSFTYADTADSTSSHWSILYRSTLVLRKDSDVFPWNEGGSGYRSRLSLALKKSYKGGLSFYLKGFSECFDSNGCIYPFLLDSGHLLLMPDERLKLYIFKGERIYRDGISLLRLLSNSSQLNPDEGAGIFMRLNPISAFYISYLHSTFNRFNVVDSHYGLPVLSSCNNVINRLSVNMKPSEWMRFGLSISQVNSIRISDNTIFSTETSFKLKNILILGEFAQSFKSSIKELSLSELRGLSLRQLKVFRANNIIFPSQAFSFYLSGLGFKSRRFGSFSIDAGYFVSGKEFLNISGEVDPGVSESRFVLWWSHPTKALLVDLCYVDKFQMAGSKLPRSVSQGLYIRFVDGIELDYRIFLTEGKGTSIVSSISSYDGSAKLSLTGRFDDIGCANKFSFLSSGWINIGKMMRMGTSLYLSPSGCGCYSFDYELRAGKSFLATVYFGSFDPYIIRLKMGHEQNPLEIYPDRGIFLSARYYLGRM